LVSQAAGLVRSATIFCRYAAKYSVMIAVSSGSFVVLAINPDNENAKTILNGLKQGK